MRDKSIFEPPETPGKLFGYFFALSPSEKPDSEESLPEEHTCAENEWDVWVHGFGAESGFCPLAAASLTFDPPSVLILGYTRFLMFAPTCFRISRKVPYPD